MQLKVLSWNIWIHGHFDQIAEFLRAADADIIGLQEVKDDDPNRNVIKFLEDLGYHYIYTPAIKDWKGKPFRDGPALFTKHKIKETKIHSLSDTEQRFAVQADIETEKGIVHAFSTHFLHTHQKPSEIQTLQGENLLKMLPSERVILMGDFNAVPESPMIKKISETLNDADPSASPTWCIDATGCEDCKLQTLVYKLDYIFTSKDLNAHSFKVEDSKGSDHLAISAIVEI